MLAGTATEYPNLETGLSAFSCDGGGAGERVVDLVEDVNGRVSPLWRDTQSRFIESYKEEAIDGTERVVVVCTLRVMPQE
jgi:hypothetical protein